MVSITYDHRACGRYQGQQTTEMKTRANPWITGLAATQLNSFSAACRLFRSWIGRCDAVLRVWAAVRALILAGRPARIGSDNHANLSEWAAGVTIGTLVCLATGGVWHGRQAYHT